jgi:hypothetical protein
MAVCLRQVKDGVGGVRILLLHFRRKLRPALWLHNDRLLI